jgi:hypothetical protein
MSPKGRHDGSVTGGIDRVISLFFGGIPPCRRRWDISPQNKVVDGVGRSVGEPAQLGDPAVRQPIGDIPALAIRIERRVLRTPYYYGGFATVVLVLVVVVAFLWETCDIKRRLSCMSLGRRVVAFKLLPSTIRCYCHCLETPSFIFTLTISLGGQVICITAYSLQWSAEKLLSCPP